MKIQSLKKFAGAAPPALPPSSMGGMPPGGQAPNPNNPAQQKVNEQQMAKEEGQAAAPDANPQIMAANQAAEQATMEAQQQMQELQMQASQEVETIKQEAMAMNAQKDQEMGQMIADKDKEIQTKEIELQLAKAEAKLAEREKDLDIKGLAMAKDDVGARVENIRGKLQKSAMALPSSPMGHGEVQPLPAGTLAELEAKYDMPAGVSLPQDPMHETMPATALTTPPSPQHAAFQKGDLQRMNDGLVSTYTGGKSYLPYRPEEASFGWLGDTAMNLLVNPLIYGRPTEALSMVRGDSNRGSMDMRPGQLAQHLGMQALNRVG